MVKIRVSYDHPEELAEVVARLGQGVKRVRCPNKESGQFLRAYIELDNLCLHHTGESGIISSGK